MARLEAGILTPSGMAQLRADLVTRVRDDQIRMAVHETGEDAKRSGRSLSHPILGSCVGGRRLLEVFDLEMSLLREAELFFVSKDMADLSRIAAQALPPFELVREDVPSRIGLVVFDGPGFDIDYGGVKCQVAGLLWYDVMDKGIVGLPFLWRDSYCDGLLEVGMISANGCEGLKRSQPQLVPPINVSFFWPYGGREAQQEVDPGDTLFDIGRAVRSAWLLMSQPLAMDRDLEYNRADRRRFQRAGVEQTRVRVISLRRQASEPSGGGDSRDWHHRWMVRGHWRMQPFGPGRERVRPVWIAPHIKGPEGAPLLGGEKVHHLHR